MTLFRTIFFAVALCLPIHLLAATPEAATPSASISTRMARIVAGWLAIPEHHLTPSNHLKNSLPWLTQKLYKESAKKIATRIPDLGERYTTQWGLFGATVFAGPVALRKVRSYSNIAASSPLQGLIPANEKMELHLPLATFKEYDAQGNVTQKTEYSWPTAIRYTLDAQRIIASWNNRRKLLPRVQLVIPCIASRTVPPSMHGKKYIIIESPTGYFIRNYPALCKAFLSITVAARRLLEVFKADDSAPRGTQTSGVQIHTLRSPMPTGPGPQPSPISLICRTLYGYAGTIFKVLRALSQEAKVPLGKIITQLPWATHLYILEADLKKLPAGSQAELYQLASEDAFDAVETLNNALLKSYKLLTKPAIPTRRSENPQQPNPTAQPRATGRGHILGNIGTPPPETSWLKTSNNPTDELETRSMQCCTNVLDDSNALRFTHGTRQVTAAWCTTCAAYHKPNGVIAWAIRNNIELPTQTVARNSLYNPHIRGNSGQ